MPGVSLEISGADVEQESLPVLSGTTVVGRAPTSTILLNHPMVSRRHAEIRSDSSGAQIADMGSANGTRVNDVELPVKEWHSLRVGDLVEIGPFTIRVTEETPPSASATEMFRTGTVLISAAVGPVLRVQTPDGNSRDTTLTAPSYTLGRSPENDIVINDPAVSRFHSRLEKRGDTYEIIDLESTNGLVLDGVKVERRVLTPGDLIRIGQSIEIEFRAAESVAEPPKAAPIDLRSSQEVLLGRGADADGLIDHPQVSRVHARILNVDGRLVIEDAGSEAGTFVNGERVDRHILNEGDAIRLGGQALKLVDGQLTTVEDDELTLEAVALRRVVGGGKTILHDVSISIRAREFVAIVGPSGAGKSTLMTALCGYQQADHGNVLINDIDFYSHIEAFRSDIGFVPQDDIIHRELPIQRALAYAARLRMPEDTQGFEREGRIFEVMDELVLSQHANTPVSRLSGGQRKRVSIGVELLTRPGLLFLDEATSGLDPGTETQMMKLFRQLADNGRIVMLVTHATKNVMICDKVVFMAPGGYLAFYGPPEEALTYFGAKEFDEIYLKLGERAGEEWANMFMAYSHQGANGYRGVAVSGPGAKTMKDTAPSRSSIKQFFTLTARSFEILLKTPKDLAVQLLLAPILGLFFFVLWKSTTFDPVKGSASDALNIFLILIIETLLVGSLSSVREIVKEQAIYKRERMVSLKVLPYVSSKVFIGFIFATLSASALFGLQIVSVDFSSLTSHEMIQLYLAILLATCSGVMIGLLVSALSSADNNAILVTIGVIIIEFLLSGALVVDMPKDVKNIVTAPVSAKWAYASMVTASKVQTGHCTADDLRNCHMPGGDKSESAKQTSFSLLEPYGDIFNVNVKEYLGAMGAIMAVMFVLLIVIQKRKDVV